jgi:hypothetical protein
MQSPATNQPVIPEMTSTELTTTTSADHGEADAAIIEHTERPTDGEEEDDEGQGEETCDPSRDGRPADCQQGEAAGGRGFN